MKYLGFNKKNEKTLKITCDISEETKDNKILMKNIVAVLDPRSRIKNEVRISGDLGIVESNLINFVISGNAKIESKNFSMESSLFELKDKYYLTTDKNLKYSTNNLKGHAKKMDINMDSNVFNFINTEGTYKVEDKLFNYKSDYLQIQDKKQIMILEKKQKENIIEGEEFFLKGDWILTKFTEDYKSQIHSFTHKNCHFLMKKKSIEDEDVIEKRRIKANVLELYYTESGDISSIDAREGTRLRLDGKNYFMMVTTNILNMKFFEKKQSIKSIEMESIFTRLVYKKLSDDGPASFRLIGKEINVLYNEDGKITEFEAFDNKRIKYSSDIYFARGKYLKYDLQKKIISIKNDALLEIDEKKRFNSKEIIINTETNTLSTIYPVSTKINLEQKSILFSTDPIFINSKSMKMNRDKKIMKFTGSVNLIQDDISIKTDKLIISEKNGIKCKSSSDSKAVFIFTDNDKEVIISGENIELIKEKKIINITGKAVIKDGDNKIKGDNLVIHFDNDEKMSRITGMGNIFFKKEDLEIESDSVKWLYVEELVYFDKLKHIKKKATGSIKGERIRLNLKTNTMSGVSESDERTETVLD